YRTQNKRCIAWTGHSRLTDQKTNEGCTTCVNGNRFLQHRDRFPRSSLCDKHSSQIPEGFGIVWLQGEHAAQLMRSLIVVTSVEENMADIIAAGPERIQLPGSPGPGNRLLRTPLAGQPVCK